MALKIGDKVRFLDSVGGGIVKRFISKELVAVEEEDGFETPIMIKECVVIESVTTQNSNKNSYKDIAPASQSQMPTPKIVETRDGDVLNLLLAFLPVDDRNIQTTSYETFFVNDSNYYVQFNYLSKQGKGWILRHTATVEPNQQVFVEEFAKEQLNDLERICMQIVAFKRDKPFDLKPAISVEHRVDTVKFYKLHSFQENQYFEDKAMLLWICKNDKPEHTFSIDASELMTAMKSKGDFKQPVKPKDNQNLPNSILEIDLHANELLDTTSGLNNSEIIRIQLDKFHQVLKENQGSKGKKIVFIHGKGEGVLRKAILDELKLRYKTYLFQDASFKEYGFGATMITIK
ncbi:MAG: DUF2027 domain-containing protein [Bacteroidales bacterium]